MIKTKKILIITATFFLIVLLTGCFNNEKSPEMAVGQMLKSVKESNIEKAKQFITDPSQLNIKTEDEKRQFNLISSNLEYEVKETVEEKDDKAIVKVRIANFDLNKILDEAIVLATEKVMKENPNNNNISDEQTKKALDETLIETIKNYKGDLVGGTISVNVLKKDGEWLVEFNNEIQNYILGKK